METAIEDPIRIFVGTDRSQRIGVKVLEYSIARHTQRPFEVISLEDVQLPEPEDKRQVQRTGFSFARFAIPKLAGFRGKAIYMDADMLVFRDIGELWDLPFNGRKMLIQEAVAEPADASADVNSVRLRKKQCAVALLDCGALDWHPEKIIAGLDGEYNYEQLMSELCILNDEELGYSIPAQWNSLEVYNSDTCNLHFTDMPTQPWVSTNNPLGFLWLATLRDMLDEGVIDEQSLLEEVRLGYARPSLLTELDDLQRYPVRRYGAANWAARLRYALIDRRAGYQKHRAVIAANLERKQKQQEYVAHRQENALRVLFVANSANLPTLQLAFMHPLRHARDTGHLHCEVLSEATLRKFSRIRLLRRWSLSTFIDKTLQRLQPDLVVMCRYTGPMAEHIVDRARENGARIISCIDDDLLDVPPEIGEQKYRFYQDTKRKARLRYSFDHADAIYSSTAALSERLSEYDVAAPIHTASLFCPGRILNTAESTAGFRIGYMGFGHEHDLQLALPGLIHVLDSDFRVELELFGTIARPAELSRFGDRVRLLAPNRDYGSFLQQLASRRWSIGICPLADLEFNGYKTSTKWLEYSCVGTAVVASDHPVYRDVIGTDCGLLIEQPADWPHALESLLGDEQRRRLLVRNAQQKVQNQYSEHAYLHEFERFLGKLGLPKSLGLNSECGQDSGNWENVA